MISEDRDGLTRGGKRKQTPRPATLSAFGVPWPGSRSPEGEPGGGKRGLFPEQAQAACGVSVSGLAVAPPYLLPVRPEFSSCYFRLVGFYVFN